MIDLRCGMWQDALRDFTPDNPVDSLIFDAPYSKETHEGSAEAERYDGVDPAGMTPDYGYLTRDDVFAFVESWHPRCSGWMASITDDVLAPIWKEAYRSVDRVAFASVPIVMRGMSLRNLGDGPSSWAVYAMVSRPRGKKWIGSGARPGAYECSPPRDASKGRGKPHKLLSALVRDYSTPGELVCDPFAGWGSTLIAARSLNRRAVGAEMDAEAYAKATGMIDRPAMVDLFAEVA